MEGNKIAPVDGKSFNYLGNNLEVINNRLSRIEYQNDAILKGIQMLLSGSQIKGLFDEIDQEKANRLEEMLSQNENHIPYID